jgi:seryl-tRNA synthetase
MPDLRPGTPEQAEFLEALVDVGLLIPSGVPGVFGRSADFERIRSGFEEMVTEEAAGDSAERISFPPVLPRRQIEEIGYLKSFPHLAGSLFSFEGDEEQAAEQQERAGRHEDWSDFQRMTDLMLSPAGCYPVYPAVAARGPLPAGGLSIDVGGAYVFRREPSRDPARLQAFHMRELVRLGEPEEVSAWRDSWLDRSVGLLRGIGLEVDFDVANDPFFGRSGRLLARSQRSQQLKFEVLAPISGPQPTAVASFNYHQDHFAGTYGIVIEGGEQAHTACLGFGLERIVLALLRRHGLKIEDWPSEAKARLGLG